MIRLELPYIVPTFNTMLRMHWAEIREIKLQVRKDLVALHHAQGLGKPLAKTPAVVTITRCSSHELDTDNLYGSAKVILDALKGVRDTRHLQGWIVDDAPTHCNLTCAWLKVKRPGKPYTVITVDYPGEK